jgi:2,3-bisphosphoglycerate-dependent phosphoglycerate mutase
VRRSLPLLLSALLSVFIVRHGERAALKGMKDDPPLTKAGRTRAEELARVLSGVKLSAVFASEYKRTQQTAAPAAKKAGLEVQPRSSEDMPALAAELKKLPAGADALVVGHTDTIGDLVTALGGSDKLGTLPDDEYDNLFIVDLEKDGAARLHRLRYGAPSAPKKSR